TGFRCEQAEYGSGKLSLALRVADSQSYNVLGVDLAMILAAQGATYDESEVYLKEVVVESLSLDQNANLATVEFQDCVFSRLDLPPDVPSEQLPVFRRCHFALVTGRTGIRDLPVGRFPDSDVEEFELAAS